MTEKQEITTPQEAGTPTPYTGPTGLADNITAKDLRLPRIALLQALSPQVQNSGDKYKPGMFIETLSQEILTSPIEFIPVFVFKNAIKWRPRAEGGGIIYKTLNFTADVMKDLQWNGTEKPVADEYINAVVLVKDQIAPLVISFSRTNLKTGQDLATLIQLSGQAWKYTYLLDSVKVTNAKGTFYVIRTKRGNPTNADQIVEAATLYEQVKGMAIETDFEEAAHTDETSAAPSEF